MSPGNPARSSPLPPTLRHVFELTVLNEVGAICASAQSSDEVLTRTTRLIADSLFPDNCGYLLLDRERRVLVPHESFVLTNPDVVSAEIPLSTGLTGKTARTGQPWRIGDIRLDPDYLDTDSRTRSELCLPLRVRGEVLGVMNIENSQPEAFSEADERLMIAALDLVGATLERLDHHDRLQASEARFRRMLDSLPLGVFVHDGRKMYFANPMAMQIMGVDSVDRLYQMSPLEIVAPVHREMASQRIETLLRTREPLPTVEAQICRLDGSLVDVEVNSIWTEFAGRDCVQVHFTDITDRKRAEQALRLSEQRFGLFMQHLPGLSWIKDADGRYVYANDAAVKVFRTTSAQLIGKTDQDLFPSETAVLFQSADRQALAQGQEVQTVETLEHADGVLHHSLVSKFPLPGPDGQLSLVGGIALDITERKQAEEALQQSQQSLKSIAEATPHWIYVFDLDELGVTYTNHSLLLDLGHPPGSEQAVRSMASFANYMPPSEWPHLARLPIEWQAMSDGQFRDDEYHLNHADGSVRSFASREVVYARRPDGTVKQILGTLTDITRRKQAERALAESEQRFRELADAIPQIVWIAGADGGLTHLNAKASEYTGIGVDQLTGWSWDQVIHPDDLPATVAVWMECVQDGIPRDVAFRIRRVDNTYRWHITRQVPVRDSSGNIASWYGTCTDIEDLKRAEESLQDNESRFRLLFDGAADAIFWADAATGLLTHCNRAAETLLGRERSEIIGQPQSFLHPPEEADRYRQIFQEHAQSRSTASVEVEVIRKDGRRIDVAISPSVTVIGGQHVIQGIFRDISERKQAEHTIQKLSTFRETIIRTAAEGICVCVPAAEFPFVCFSVWNDRMTEITGYTMEEINQQGWYESLYPDPEMQLRAQKRVDRMRHGEELRAEEWEITRKDGQRRTVAISTSRLDLDENVTAMAALIQDVTEQKQAVQSLHESERSLQFFRALVNLTNDAIHVIDPITSRFLDVNDRACERLEYSRAELLQLGVIDVEAILPDHFSWQQHVLEVKAAGGMLLEGIHLRKDGGTIPVEVNVRHVTVDQQEYMVAVARDITERRQADAARQLAVDDLRRSEERFSKLFHASPFSIIVASYPEGKIVEANAAFLRIFEFSREEVLGRTTGELNIWVLPGDRQRMLESVRTRGSARNMEYLFRTKSGGHRTLVMSVEVIRLDDQDYSLAMSIDITDRKAAEAELHKTDELLRAVSQSTPDAVYVKDRESRYLLFNEAASRFVGKSATEVVGQTDLSIFDQATARAIMERDRKVVSTGLPDTVEETLSGNGGLRTFLSTKVPYRDHTGEVVGVIGVSRDISDRKTAEQTIRENEERFRLLMDSIPAYISYVDAQERYRWVNRVYEQWYQRPREQIIGRTVRELQGEENYDVMQAQIHRALRGETVHYEQTLESPNQSRRTFDNHYIPHRSDDGRVLGIYVLVFDLTVERSTQLALRESEERYRKLFETCGDAIFILDLQGNIRSVNPAAAVMHGCTLDELIGKNMRELDVPSDADQLPDRMQRLLSGETLNFEVLHRRKDGTTFPLDVAAALLHIGDEPLVLAFDRDITERKRSEDSVRQSLSLMQATLDATADGILVVDLEGRIVDLNQQFLAVWKVPAHLLVAGRKEDLISTFNQHPFMMEMLGQLQHPEAFVQRVGEIYRSPEESSFDVIEFRDGRVIERLSRPQLMGGVPVGRVWSFRDVSAQRHLEQQLRQSQKMEAVGQLAGGIAHDFNNLLTVINGYCDLLLAKNSRRNSWADSVSEIRDAGRRAAQLTEQLLSFSRKSLISLQVVALNDVVTHSEKLLRRLIGPRIVLQVELDPHTGCIRADVTQLEQVLMNLAVNAKDAMPDGGRLTITTRGSVERKILDDDSLADQWDRYVGLIVSDTGVGMTAEQCSRIFEPFFTTKEVGKGSGLGLAVVHGIVRQHGGQIQVDSQPGRGTKFTVFFPAVDDVATSSLPMKPETDHAGTETILLVEDESGVRRMARQAMEALGYRVLEASTGHAALDIARQYGETIDLLITDVVMPGMSGRQVADALREDRPQLPVMFISGYHEEPGVREVAARPDETFLRKPFSPQELTRLIRQHLDANRKSNRS